MVKQQIALRFTAGLAAQHQVHWHPQLSTSESGGTAMVGLKTTAGDQRVVTIIQGDEVVTSSGILGKVTSLDENYMVLNVSNNVDMKFQRVHLHAVLPKGTLKSIG